MDVGGRLANSGRETTTWAGGLSRSIRALDHQLRHKSFSRNTVMKKQDPAGLTAS